MLATGVLGERNRCERHVETTIYYSATYCTQNGSFERNGRQAFYPTHHANPLRAEANDRTSAPRTRVTVHTTHSVGRLRTRATFRTFPAHCNTCAHFCKLGTQSVSPLFSAQPSPSMRRAPPTALLARLAQATPLSALELSTGGPSDNILAICNAHLVVPPRYSRLGAALLCTRSAGFLRAVCDGKHLTYLT